MSGVDAPGSSSAEVEQPLYPSLSSLHANCWLGNAWCVVHRCVQSMEMNQSDGCHHVISGCVVPTAAPGCDGYVGTQHRSGDSHHVGPAGSLARVFGLHAQASCSPVGSPESNTVIRLQQAAMGSSAVLSKGADGSPKHTSIPPEPQHSAMGSTSRHMGCTQVCSCFLPLSPVWLASRLDCKLLS